MKVPISLSLLERLLLKTHFNATTECLEWLAAKDSSGYGSIGWKGKQVSTHRAMFEEIFGTIPSGMCVMHTCDNPSCINPFHLSLGTHKENMKDMQKKGRKAILMGDKHPKRKLSEKQVEYIRSSDESNSYLAYRFLVSESLIRKIKSGERRMWQGFKK